MESFFDIFYTVQFLPSKQFYGNVQRTIVHAVEMLGDGLGCTSHVSISSCLLIDRSAQFECLLNGIGAQVEEAVYLPGYFSVAFLYMAAAEGVDVDADGACYANGITDLYQHLVCYACGNHILGNVTGGISS